MIGQRVRRREDPRFLLGNGRYVDDLELEGAVHVTFVRSDLAHATIASIDSSGVPDGARVFTAADIDLPATPPMPMIDGAMSRPHIASDRVRFVGEIVAVVVADTAAAGVDAAAGVFVDYEPLPAVTDARDAIADQTLLFEQAGTNVAFGDGPTQPRDDLFDGCDVVVRGELNSQRLHVAPLEPRATAAVWEQGRLRIWVSTQTPHRDRNDLTSALSLETDQVHVLALDVGGGFGGKRVLPEDVLVAWVARKLDRPARWVETRSEHMVAMGHGRAQRISFALGGTRDGELKALALKLLQDAGAYPVLGAILPRMTRRMAAGVYRIPRIEVRFDSVVTNTAPTAALRGAGRPEAAQVVERAVDAFAVEAGLDPAAVRFKNFIEADAFPYTTPVGAEYDVGDYRLVLETALEAAGYEQLRAEQARRRAAGDRNLLGIGIATYVEVTNNLAESEFGAVEITPDGDAIVKSGSFSHGQGHETTFAQIAAAALGLPVERVTVVQGDTDRVARGTGTFGSKSTQIGGAAARKAADELVEKAKELAAEQLEADPHDMVLDVGSGAFHVAGAPHPSLDWSALAARLHAADRLPELSVETDFQPSQPTYPFGAHVVVVEVDSETGAVSIRDVIAVDDAGTIINPMIADGQIHGGVAAGIAQALYEEFAYDSNGNPLSANFVTYGIPGPTELPSFRLVRTETPTPVNPLGAKGIGESGTIGATPATLNAVIDALSHLGVRTLEMPANGEQVWRAIRDARAAAHG